MGRTATVGVAKTAVRACSESAGPLAAIGHLRTIAHLLDADHPSAVWFISRLADYEAGAPFGLSTDQAFGLVPGSGGEKWWRTENRQRRDELLLPAIARRFFADELSEPRQAALIAKRFVGFKRSVWPRYRHLKRLPDRYAGKLEELLFAVCKLDRNELGMVRGNAPGAKTMRRALATRV
jgi:hypothetical protein